MIVPQFWAEAKIQLRHKRQSITLRRFGWSDESQQAAQAHAQKRVNEALDLVSSGEKPPRRELKRSYNGSEGVPIREEILGRMDKAVLTRNLYGATCLNTPNVLFADVDTEDWPSLGFYILVDAVLVILGVILCSILFPKIWAVGFVFAAVGPFVTKPIHQSFYAQRGGAKQVSLERIRNFVLKHPEWHLRVYETPAGWRALALHQTFSPSENAVADFFHAIQADPVYVRMCKNQNCFRARVSPKPWRIGIKSHLKPRPGVWPIPPEKFPDRERWVRDYEATAADFASCRFVEEIGSPTVSPEAERVRLLHDKLCQADSTLPMA